MTCTQRFAPRLFTAFGSPELSGIPRLVHIVFTLKVIAIEQPHKVVIPEDRPLGKKQLVLQNNYNFVKLLESYTTVCAIEWSSQRYLCLRNRCSTSGVRLHFCSKEVCMGKIKMSITFASIESTTGNGIIR